MTRESTEFTHENLLRELAPQVLGAVIRRFGDFGAAEDAVQEALLAATLQWPKEGLPDNPRGWLIQVAARRVTDHLRSESARRRRETVAATDPSQSMPPASIGVPSLASSLFSGGEGSAVDATDPDDTLVLLFMCCHPSLTSSSAVALTLRAVGGLTTAEIARAFLVPESTMAQRISRAKQTIKSSGVPFSMPTRARARRKTDRRAARALSDLQRGIHELVRQSLQRTELSSEAIRLGRALHQLLPDESEVAGLLALMLLTDARRPARTGPDGELIPLDKQDRSLWDQSAINGRCRAHLGDTGERRDRAVSVAGRNRCGTRRGEDVRCTQTGRRSWRCMGY